MAGMYSFSAISADLTKTMKLMRMSKEVEDFIVERREEWPVFGKKNSHLYREQLMESMESAGLGREAKLMVYFFFSVIKNQPRVLKAMDRMPEEVKLLTWFSQVRDFIGTKVVQYVTQAERTRKFPAVNIPSTNPGLDILLWCIATKDSDRTVENLKIRTTFCQLKLNDDMQAVAKEGYTEYWNVIVRGSNNPDAASMNLPVPQMREEYYRNPASDEYPLLKKDLTVLDAMTNQTGYTRREITSYLRSFDASTAVLLPDPQAAI